MREVEFCEDGVGFHFISPANEVYVSKACLVNFITSAK